MRTILLIIICVLFAGTCKAQTGTVGNTLKFTDVENYKCGAPFDLIDAEQRGYWDSDGHWEMKRIEGDTLYIGNPHYTYILTFENKALVSMSIYEYEEDWKETTILLTCKK